MGTSFPSASNVDEYHQQRPLVTTIHSGTKPANATIWEIASQPNRVTPASESDHENAATQFISRGYR
jgi:hypothetical protein